MTLTTMETESLLFELDRNMDGIPDDTDNNGTPDYLDAEIS